jgi:hypothetical protein
MAAGDASHAIAVEPLIQRPFGRVFLQYLFKRYYCRHGTGPSSFRGRLAGQVKIVTPFDAERRDAGRRDGERRDAGRRDGEMGRWGDGERERGRGAEGHRSQAETESSIPLSVFLLSASPRLSSLRLSSDFLFVRPFTTERRKW